MPTPYNRFFSKNKETSTRVLAQFSLNQSITIYRDWDSDTYSMNINVLRKEKPPETKEKEQYTWSHNLSNALIGTGILTYIVLVYLFEVENKMHRHTKTKKK